MNHAAHLRALLYFERVARHHHLGQAAAGSYLAEGIGYGQGAANTGGDKWLG